MKKDTIKLLLIFTPALFGSFPALANVSGSDWKPQIVEKMLNYWESHVKQMWLDIHIVYMYYMYVSHTGIVNIGNIPLVHAGDTLCMSSIVESMS